MNIEERIELTNKLYSIIKEQAYDNLPQEYREFSKTKIIKLPNAELKGILFSKYSKTRDINTY